MISSVEVNFDALSGPTHNHAGLSPGNRASIVNRFATSNPRAAALQGLSKMKLLLDFGIPQGVLPPHARPCMNMLRELGFSGCDKDIIKKVSQEVPELLLAVSSSSSMWAANSATISPAVDSADGRLQITPANLAGEFHRSLETVETSRILKRIFPDKKLFKHHGALPPFLQDEGAANHLRLYSESDKPGLEIFVYGRSIFFSEKKANPIFPARQTKEASEAVARLHRLAPEATLFLGQSRVAIDAGVFHNDVISSANKNLFIFHEKSFVSPEKSIAEIRSAFSRVCDGELIALEIKDSNVSLQEAVACYLFNSQIVSRPDGEMILIAPEHCSTGSIYEALKEIEKGANPINEICFIDLNESMKNGGGPACLRLRVPMSDREFKAIHQGVMLNDTLYEKLRAWIKKHYRDRLEWHDLSDPALLSETRTALDELTILLGLGTIYEFQKE